MIAGMTPVVQHGAVVFISTEDPTVIAASCPRALSIFREAVGMSMIVPRDPAREAGQTVEHPMRCITLNVYWSLEGVGLTAAVATALGTRGIPCNMVAAFHHDHVVVPEARSDAARDILKALQREAAKGLQRRRGAGRLATGPRPCRWESRRRVSFTSPDGDRICNHLERGRLPDP